MITKTELKQWKAYREAINRINEEITKKNEEKMTRFLEENQRRPVHMSFPLTTRYVEPTITGFLDYLVKEIK